MPLVNLLSRELISLGAQTPQLLTAAGIFERAGSISVSVLSSGQYVVPYWSASPNANNSNNAWQLNFNNGNDNNNRNNNNHVRLVRSGQWFSWERDRLGRRIKNEPVGFGLWANKPTSAPNPNYPTSFSLSTSHLTTDLHR